MCEWAVSKMKKKDENGKMKSIEPYTNDDAHQLLKKYNVTVERDEAYDICYLANMFKADFLGKSLPNEQYLAMHIKAYQDDPDGNPTRAFDEFLANCIAKGIPIIWDDMM